MIPAPDWHVPPPNGGRMPTRWALNRTVGWRPLQCHRSCRSRPDWGHPQRLTAVRSCDRRSTHRKSSTGRSSSFYLVLHWWPRSAWSIPINCADTAAARDAQRRTTVCQVVQSATTAYEGEPLSDGRVERLKALPPRRRTQRRVSCRFVDAAAQKGVRNPLAEVSCSASYCL